MSEAIRFLDGLLEERLSQLHTAMPCRVERFDEAQGTADVVPLFMRVYVDGQSQPYPRLVGLPVLRRKYRGPDDAIQVERPVLEPGDMVLVVFVERALDRVLSAGRPVDPEFNRKHAIEDGIIIGLL